MRKYIDHEKKRLTKELCKMSTDKKGIVMADRCYMAKQVDAEKYFCPMVSCDGCKMKV